MNEEIKDPNQLDLFAGILFTPEQEKMIAEHIAWRNSLAAGKKVVNQHIEKTLVDAGFVYGVDFVNEFKVIETTKTVSVGPWDKRFEVEITFDDYVGDIKLKGLYFDGKQLKESFFYLDIQTSRNGMKINCNNIQDSYRYIKPSTLLEKLKESNQKHKDRFKYYQKKLNIKQYTIEKYQTKYPKAIIEIKQDWSKYNGTFDIIHIEFPSGSYMQLYVPNEIDQEQIYKMYDAEFKKLNQEEVLDMFSKQAKKEGSN
jgi:hypothetical protein